MNEEPVINAATTEELMTYMNSTDPLIIDWFADWCGPCRVIEPEFKSLGSKYGAFGLFVRCDIDDPVFEKILETLQIQAVPTFMAYQEGKMLDKLTGSDKEALRRLAKKALNVG
eukprot:TRINITY_DN17530_c0_g1_i1.p1 TRINITY_DN17530_c0_g1~~TRINITY_DN17530_c0_g1_i1.p1  ORF type:complete len:114 (+),score=34.34 TRINITY_DN17530_c0_g1_i1:73-414(+)